MFEKFEEYFQVNYEREDSFGEGSVLQCLRSIYGGKDFGNGIYRIFDSNEAEVWKANVKSAYPEYTKDFEIVSCDWLGRCFGVLTEGEEAILMFEIGTADVLVIPCNLLDFHNNEITEYAEECLAESFFEEWMEIERKSLKHNQCVGYKVPLFIGGDDELDNLEVSDMDVYWNVCSQIKAKVM